MNDDLKYPIYIPSKNRAKNCFTARCFIAEDVNFKLVIEPAQVESYRQYFDEKYFLVLPENNVGLLGARLFIRDHSIKAGATRHWQFDDNIYHIIRLHKGKRINCNSKTAIRIIEEFTDRYQNIGISGFNYEMFVRNDEQNPLILNHKVYSAVLINNDMPYKWRLRYNDDTDLCLQVLANNLCTVQFNALCVKKVRTMVVPGGNTDDLYKDNGRLRMARTLEEMWPQFVKTKIRFRRPQHVVDYSSFTQKLIRRTDIDWTNMPKVNNFGLHLVANEHLKSKSLHEYFKQERQSH